MLSRRTVHFSALLALGLLAACGNAAGPAALAPSQVPGATAPQPAPATATASLAATQPAPATSVSMGQAATQPAASGDIPESVTPEGYHVLGRADAPVTLTMYSDFLWTVCAFHVLETEPEIIKNYIATGKVKLVYRHLLQLGEGSLRTGEASECAADQGKFWPMREMLYARQDSVYSGTELDATLAAFAKDLGLDTAAFSSCMQAHKHQQFVQDDYRAAVAAGVRFRPAFDINGVKLTGGLPFAAFQKQIDAALSK